ncbi:iron ABC transporter permease [Marinilabilia rubra]|uniref:Iron ABC transporter n=1 Tax=Marinilabilia rubra TaxID=2162893 RepID=A0A2U2B411_9BACT|nr:iron ABC transporter permease [Marinilabilia rubra]PWD97800.1 iron ABC transporter [Marinilabilia rubra]
MRKPYIYFLKGRQLTFFLISGLIILSIALFLLNLIFGSVNIPINEVVKILLGNGSTEESWRLIVLKSRLPQTVTAILAGAGLAVGGLQMQTLFRNPLAGPSILGISSGAGLGVALVLLLAGKIGGVALSHLGWTGHLSVALAAFAGASLILTLVLFLSRHLKDNAMLLIVGIMVGYAASALVGILKFYSMKEDVHAYVIWGLGSFSTVSWSQMWVLFPIVVLGLFGSFFLVKPLNVMLLGEQYAGNLGINISLSRLLIILCTGLLTATITAFCGPIAFLGLAVPHLTKGLFRTSDHKVLLPAVVFAGMTVALFSNLIARLPGFDGALPINAVTSMIGAPVVISVILKGRNLRTPGV